VKFKTLALVVVDLLAILQFFNKEFQNISDIHAVTLSQNVVAGLALF
jgi:hypothetical protein